MATVACWSGASSASAASKEEEGGGEEGGEEETPPRKSDARCTATLAGAPPRKIPDGSESHRASPTHSTLGGGIGRS